MLQAKIINKINFPQINLQSTLEEIAERIIIQDIKNRMVVSKAITGGSLPDNEPKTRERKDGKRPLLDTGKLQNSFSYKSAGKDRVVIYIEPVRKDIAGYLQNDGIQLKSGQIKYYRFFGISEDAFRRSMVYADKKINDLTKKK